MKILANSLNRQSSTEKICTSDAKKQEFPMFLIPSLDAESSAVEVVRKVVNKLEKRHAR